MQIINSTISSYRVLENNFFYTQKDCLFVNIFVIEDEELQKFICVNLKSCFVRGLARLSMTHIWRSEAESWEKSELLDKFMRENEIALALFWDKNCFKFMLYPNLILVSEYL